MSTETRALTPTALAETPSPSRPAPVGSIRVVRRPTVTRETTGDRLLRLRTAQGWTQEALAHEIGLTKSAIGKFELGLATPYVHTLDALAEALGVSMEYLWKGTVGCGHDEASEVVR